jgi:hypothetical protein
MYCIYIKSLLFLILGLPAEAETLATLLGLPGVLGLLGLRTLLVLLDFMILLAGVSLQEDREGKQLVKNELNIDLF